EGGQVHHLRDAAAAHHRDAQRCGHGEGVPVGEDAWTKLVTRAMISEMKARLPVGLIGLGRLGRVYARDLATRVPSARLVAVADPAPGVAEAVAKEFEISRWHADPASVLDDPEVKAVVIVSPPSTHRERTTSEDASPKSSGGMIADMGVHDFDLARWFMGEAKTVHAVGGTLAYPELKTVGDLDNAVVSIVFADGRLGVVDLSRNGIYG